MIHLSFPMGLKIGESFIPFHLFFEILAFYIGYHYYSKLRQNQTDHFNDSQRLSLILAAAIGALFGSRFLAALEHIQALQTNFSWMLLTQSKTILGGLIGGWIAIEITKKIYKIKKSSGDLFTFPIILALMIGRIGCAATGVADSTAGIASNLPWAFNQGDGIPRHPTAIYEIIFLGLLWILLKKIPQKYQLKNGDIFKIFMASYSFWRFLVEFIKPREIIALNLSAIQIASLLVILYYTYNFTTKIRA